LGDQIEKRWAGHVACIGERRGAYRVLVKKCEGNRPLGSPRLRWENDGLPGSEMGGGAWTGLIWLRIETGGRHLSTW